MNLSEEEERPKLRLKNGSEVDARAAYVDWKLLQATQQKQPAEFAALLALARSEQMALTEEAREELRRRNHFAFDSDGNLDQVAGAIILSAYRETPDGPMLVNPFQLSTEAERELFDETERKVDNVFLRFLRRGRESGGGSRGPRAS